MNWKDVVRRTVPPFVLDLFSHYWHGTRPGFVWEGVYDCYRDVPATPGHFDSASWVGVSRAAVTAIAGSRGPDAAWAADVGEHAPLAVLAAVVGAEHGSVAILDFGGGAGEAFAAVAAGVLGGAALRYHVVETGAVCDAGRALWKDDQRIAFHPEPPASLTGLDIVYISSALQYVEDYGGLLDVLCQYGPRYMLMVKLSAGGIPTFASAQRNRRGAAIPYWFINGNEIVERMQRAGYRLVMKRALSREYDQSNFPPEYRLGRTCDLLFAREPGV